MSRSYSGGEITFDDSGMEDFEKMLKQYAAKADPENALDAIETGAKEFVNDLIKAAKTTKRSEKARIYPSDKYVCNGKSQRRD